MSNVTTAPDAAGALDYAPAPSGGAGRLRLHRMPLVWVAVAVPAAFLFALFFLMPSL
jgi:hypothetical protein